VRAVADRIDGPPKDGNKSLVEVNREFAREAEAARRQARKQFIIDMVFVALTPLPLSLKIIFRFG
jgi:hypothetical protein